MRIRGRFLSGLLNLTLFGASVAFCAGSLEWFSRTWVLQRAVPENDESFRRILSTIRPWQSPAPLTASPQGTGHSFRILGIADSFGCSHTGSGQNYHDYLQRWALSEGRASTQVVNLSVQGYETPEELVMLRDFGLRMKPEVTLHGFYVGNDTELCNGRLGSVPRVPVFHWEFWDPLRPSTWVFLNWIEQSQLARSEIKQLRAEGYPAARLASYGLRRFRKELVLGTHLGPEQVPPVEELLNQAASSSRFVDIIRFQARHYEKLYVNSFAWSGVRKNLQAMIEASRAAGSRHVIAIFPDELQVDPGLQSSFFDRTRSPRGNYDFELPQKLLKEVAREAGAEVIDVLPVFRKWNPRGSLYLTRNLHLGARGNWLIARVVYQRLKELSLLGPRVGSSSTEIPALPSDQ